MAATPAGTGPPSAPPGSGSRQAWLIWGAAVLTYLAAVFHRGTLGVAGPLAIERFEVGPAALSAFTVLQVGIYAAMQIPTGLLVDRFGSRRILTAAVLLLGCGQLLFALATSYPMGLLARGVLGVGDALTWVSILRLVATRFSARQYALVATVSAALGALGGVAATFPLTALLGALGWTWTFLLVGAITAAYAAVTAGVVRDVPGTTSGGQDAGEILRKVRSAWAIPGTRLAFWAHFGTMFVPNALSLLWGYPYLVEAVGVPPATASVVLSLLIIGQVAGGPFVGALIGRFPACRMPIVLGYLAGNGLAWLVLLSFARPPLAVVCAAFLVFAMGGPVSSIAFALVRDYNPISQVGTATGIANVGGHSATALSVLSVGLLLQLAGDYRVAMLALLAFLLLSVFRTAVWWRRTRAAVLTAQDRGDPVPVLVRRRRWDLAEEASAPVA
ncbi:MFS transporter [Saccharopolyspora gloriosae]|uniref:MFS transporter n=1 Tax=Saccharopolyspora gloriosae TaxID=455344 RepID=UPI001FB7E74D|nr:MFS transporter [Saccharopolyspora gloriosae]